MAELPDDGVDPWGDELRAWLLTAHQPSGLIKSHAHTIADVTGLTAALQNNAPAPNPDFPPGQNVTYNVGGAKNGKVLVYVNSNLVVVSDDADPAGIYTRTVAQLTGASPLPPTADIGPSDDFQAEVAAMGNGNTIVLAPGDYGADDSQFFMSGSSKEIIGLPGARWVGDQFRVTGSGHIIDGMTFDQRNVAGKDVEFTGASLTAIRCKFTNQYTGIKTYLGSGGRATDMLFEDCFFYNIGRSGLSNIFDHAIYAAQCDDLVVRECRFHQVIGGYGIHGYPDCQGSLVEDCKFLDSHAWVMAGEGSLQSENNLMNNCAMQWTRTLSPQTSPFEAPNGRSSNGGSNNDITHCAVWQDPITSWGRNGIDETELDTVSGNTEANPQLTVPNAAGQMTIQNGTVATFLGFS